jgi:hypothetical protein
MLVGFVNDPRTSVIGIVEFALWGPRQALDAIGKLRRKWLFAAVKRERVVDVLAALMACNHANVEQMLKPGEDPAGLLAALAYSI